LKAQRSKKKDQKNLKGKIMQLGYEQLEVWQRSVEPLEQEALEIAAMLKGLINAISKNFS
jgi:hypothetical protein